MVYDEVYFGGEVLPCVVEKFPVIRKPQRKFTSYNIPGRNGDIIVQQDAYENVIVPYQIYCGEGDVQADWTDLANVLYKDGYQKLSDISDPDHFRMGVFNGGIDAAYYWEKVGRTTLEFNCRPERYRVDGAKPISYSSQSEWVYALSRQELLDNYSNQVITWLNDTTIEALEDETQFYLCTIASWYPQATPTVIIPCRDDGQEKEFFVADDARYTTTGYDQYPNTTGKEMSFDGQLYEQSGMQIIIPSYCIVGLPMVYLDRSGVVETYGTSHIINNPYMKSYPSLVLHRVTDHYSTEPTTNAVRINNHYLTITQKYASDPAYYFVDTENMVVTSAATLDGVRSLANNAWIGSGMYLRQGENAIYPGMYYDVTITPNLWEL